MPSWNAVSLLEPPKMQTGTQCFIQTGRMDDGVSRYWGSHPGLSSVYVYVVILWLIPPEEIKVCWFFFSFFPKSHQSSKLLLAHIRFYLFLLHWVTANGELPPKWSLWKVLMWFVPLPMLQLWKSCCCLEWPSRQPVPESPFYTLWWKVMTKGH